MFWSDSELQLCFVLFAATCANRPRVRFRTLVRAPSRSPVSPTWSSCRCAKGLAWDHLHPSGIRPPLTQIVSASPETSVS